MLFAVAGLNLGGMGGKAFSQAILLLKVGGVILGVCAIMFVIWWLKSWKDEIYIFSKGTGGMGKDKGRIIKRKDGTIGYKFFKTMFMKPTTIPPPDDTLALTSSKGKRIFFCTKVGINQYHFVRIPKDFESKETIEIIPHDMVNWFIETDKMNRRKFQNAPDWKQWMLPVAFAVFVVMVCITLIYLFKELPTSIAVDVVQSGSQDIPGFT